MIENIKEWEKAVVDILNLDGWQLELTKEYDHYDAIGITPKGIKCVIEMKFRNDYYEDKMLEKFKYDKLMKMEGYVKIYFVNDAKGNYMFWLDDMVMPEVKYLRLPKQTLWDKTKVSKAVYLLSENKATIINRNE
jgi:Holliday junction resolvase-like predicted endonuclease